MKRKLLEKETENETLLRELSSKNNVIATLKSEKQALQREIETIRHEMIVSSEVWISSTAERVNKRQTAMN